MFLKKIFLAFSFVCIAIQGSWAFDTPLPPPSLKGQDRVLVGKWVQVKSYCSHWSNIEIDAYNKNLRDQLYSEVLFVNLWEAKFMQSQVDPKTPKRPYAFCQRDLFFYPTSMGGTVWLREGEIAYSNQCGVDSVLEGLGKAIEWRYQITGHPTRFLVSQFKNWPGCQGSNYVVFFKRGR